MGFGMHSFLHNSYLENILPYYFYRIITYGAGYIQVFATFEVLFFAYALIQRYVELKNENEIRIANSLKVQKFVMEEMTTLIKTRTKQMEIANLTLEENGQKISEMNRLLQEDNESLIKDVELLKKARFIDPNLSFIDFKNTFHSEEIAHEFLAQLKWKNGYGCKKCNYKKYYLLNNSVSRKCKSCGYTESAIADTL